MEFFALAFAHDAAAFAKPLLSLLDQVTHFASNVQAPNAAPLGPPPSAAPLQPIDVATTSEGGTNAVVDMSPLALFMKADIVVKGVMAVLLFASFWSWAIILGKWMRISSVRAQADKFEQLFWSGRSLDDVYATLQARQDHHPMAHVFVSGMREWKRSFETGHMTTGLIPSVKDRIHRVMNA